MTRQHKLTPEQKNFAVNQVLAKYMTVTDLAIHFKVHPRTIYRAMEEAGHGTAQTDRKMPAGKKALEILKKHGVSVDDLDSLLVRASIHIPLNKPTVNCGPALFHPAPTVATH